MRPVQIKQVSPTELLIGWDDQHESLFTTEYLRSHCPCATCLHDKEQDAHSGTFSLPLANQTQLKGIKLSGHNAIVITWGDGHNTGIYTWEYLRNICPCPKCKVGSSAAGLSAS